MPVLEKNSRARPQAGRQEQLVIREAAQSVVDQDRVGVRVDVVDDHIEVAVAVDVAGADTMGSPGNARNAGHVQFSGGSGQPYLVEAPGVGSRVMAEIGYENVTAAVAVEIGNRNPGRINRPGHGALEHGRGLVQPCPVPLPHHQPKRGARASFTLDPRYQEILISVPIEVAGFNLLRHILCSLGKVQDTTKQKRV